MIVEWINKWVTKSQKEIMFDVRIKKEQELSGHQFGEERCSKCREPYRAMVWRYWVTCHDRGLSKCLVKVKKMLGTFNVYFGERTMKHSTYNQDHEISVNIYDS